MTNINGSWKTWLLGVVATLAATLIGNGILFQRETRESLAHIEERLKYLEGRGRDTLIREFHNRDAMIHALELRIDRLEKK